MAVQPPVIAAIGAVASNGMLGLAGWLPWDIPEELAYFEATVAGAALLVGRLTYESMLVVPDDTFVISRQRELPLRPGCQRAASVEAGLLAAVATGKPVFVIGGASIYAAAWPYCQRFYLTRIELPFAGDTLFPASIPLNEWAVLSDEGRVYLERKTGRPVMCRFLQYVQEMPRPIGRDDCKSPMASAESPFTDN
ncbi:MAG: dihydrofolate reductase [Azonexus sp.]